MKPTHGWCPIPASCRSRRRSTIRAHHRDGRDNALLLEVLAGPDGLDPRQINITTAPYTKALGSDAKGLKVAVVREGFGHATSESDVDALVRKGRRSCARSAPASMRSRSRCTCGTRRLVAIAHEGATVQMMHGNGYAFQLEGALRHQPHEGA